MGVLAAILGSGILVLVVVASRDIKIYCAEHMRLALPAEREQLMCFGTIMMMRNREATRILLREGACQCATTASADLLKAGLIESWGVNDDCSARNAIQDLIIEGRRALYNEDFKRIQRGESLDALQSLSGDDYLRWMEAKGGWVEAGLALPDVQSMAAYDYERIAWLARSCYWVGYLTEEECLRCLAWVASQAVVEFDSWEAYAASFVLGRAATYSGDSDIDPYIQAVTELLSKQDVYLERPHIWQEYPLSRICVPDALKDMGEATVHVPPRDAFLGLGALIAQSFSASHASFSIPADDQYPTSERWLADNWNVADAESLCEALEWFISTGSRTETDSVFQKLAQGAVASRHEGVHASQVISLNRAKEILRKSGVKSEYITSDVSLVAYDVERAAFGLRLSCSLGYICENKARSYLRRLAMLARGAFEAWDSYMASFVLAQAFFNDDADYVDCLVRSGKYLCSVVSPFAQHQSPWQRYPLASLPVLQRVNDLDTSVIA